MIARLAALFACVVMAVPVGAQTPAASSTGEESGFRAELRREGERLREKCGTFDLKSVGSCAIALATDHPLHVAFGSIAPQNGMGFGPALVMHATPNENWRLNWNADVVGAVSGAWRAGGYLKIVRTAVGLPVVTNGPSDTQADGIHLYPVIDVYAQTISLPTLAYFGLGPDSSRSGKSLFGMRETMFGTGARIPIRAGRITQRLNLSVLADVTARSVDLRPSESDDAPSIEQLYSEATAPGLADQPFVAQFGEGVRLNPSVANGRLRLNYLTRLDQYVASDSTYSFRRWTLDLDHEIPFYRASATRNDQANGPDDCAIDPSTRACPSVSRNRTGTANVRMLVSRSAVSNGAVVPFYFQQTLGGSDINGNRGLGSYDDYRFRGPKLILFRESIEHSIGTWPVGIWLAADQGRVSLQEGNGQPSKFRRSFTAGLSVRAGGFPAVLLSWSTGGSEGSHVAFTINASVLGGGSRPSLH